ncbi:MAG: hypothetical protein WDA42_04175 [Candidatus Bathyarchaeia archaeon]
MYRENPKTKGSGILCCIPQTGRCPNNCKDCFFQSGRSYLEPLDKNLPNMPLALEGYVIRVNDGNDSNVCRDAVIKSTDHMPMRFFNTAIPKDIGGFPAPVVLTVNPADKTDVSAVLLTEIPNNLMFVRVRTNLWNTDIVDTAIKYYTQAHVPVVLTFMAYWGEADTIKEEYKWGYQFRKRTLNSYWAITYEAWRKVMDNYAHNPLVYSCGTEGVVSACKNCGNCLREYFATMTRIRKDQEFV